MRTKLEGKGIIYIIKQIIQEYAKITFLTLKSQQKTRT
jgi:hypothetical protein